MNMSGLLSALILLTIQGSLAQRVRVEPEVVSYPGQMVTLRCLFPNPGETQLTQVSWIFERNDAERTNIAVFHPKFGANYPTKSPVSGRVSFVTDPPSLDNPSIQIREVKMTDEGRYICEYATYPSGNEQGVTSLVMLAKPKNLATTVTVTAGKTPVIVARCESSNGRPAATISWSTPLNGNVTTPIETENPDNTVTVQSSYMLVPQPSDNGKDISCMVTHRTMTQPETFPMRLVVEYPPRVQIVGYDNNWYRGRTSAYLTCQADGNPVPTTITWKTLSGLMPETVQVQENRLAVQKVDDTINNTFICEVKNSLGYGRDQITVFVREFPQPVKGAATGGIFGGILCVIILVALIATIVMVRNCKRKNKDGPPTHKPPPPMKSYSYSDRPSIDTPVSDSQSMHHETEKEEPMTDLSAYHDDKDHHEPSRFSWEDKQSPYQDDRDEDRMMGEEDGYYITSSASRGSSFMSPAVIV
ncbi:nectin-2-like isoform X2 [Sinocyclocheilus rhinocerous]|uniref:Nectin cell adhesion molecule 3 n=1 Tax=Sinocyclocheilus rhinocerous TaxID=307959 RepID=A0A673IVT2_9TELE|nr:PREDICTED: nectin-2-like isoform X2 [Sinocyclocheilus rhinocerous]